MGLKSYVETVKKRDPAMRSSIEIVLYATFWAMLNHRIAHFLYKHKLFFLARLVSQLSRFFTGIEIHPGAVIGKGLFIDHGAGVVIGETCIIGDDVLIYQGVTLGGTGKDIGKRHPTIGNNVMIGAGVKILGPFKVGDNCRIGAGSVVLNEIPPNTTAVGIPAKIINKREIKDMSDCLDRIEYPDIVQQQICQLTKKIRNLEKKIEEIEKIGGKNEDI